MCVSEYHLKGLPTEDELVREVNRAVVELKATVTLASTCEGTLEITQKKGNENE